MTRIIIVRHGETTHNRQHIIQGHLDTELNAKGEEQAEQVARILHEQEPNIDAIFSSTLSRAYKTAQIIAGVNRPVYDAPGFRERYMGELEGMTRQAAVLKRNQEHKKSLLEYGEGLDQLVKRLLEAWDELSQTCKERNYSNIVLVSHGGALYQLFEALIKRGYSFANMVAKSRYKNDSKIGNCSVTIVDLDKKHFELYAEQWVESIVRHKDET